MQPRQTVRYQTSRIFSARPPCFDEKISSVSSLFLCVLFELLRLFHQFLEHLRLLLQTLRQRLLKRPVRENLHSSSGLMYSQFDRRFDDWSFSNLPGAQWTRIKSLMDDPPATTSPTASCTASTLPAPASLFLQSLASSTTGSSSRAPCTIRTHPSVAC